MIGLVRIALRRPYTFVVLALLIVIIGPLAALRTPTDIFPDIRIPVISVVFTYTGLPAEPMAGRIVTPFQRALTTTVNDIEHIEANSYSGFGIIKIFFQRGVDIDTANAQVTSISQTLLRQMPQGTNPPLVINYSASTVSIIQLALSGKGMSEQALSDLGNNSIRTRLVTVPGAAIPGPYGGKTRQVQIDLDPVAAQARGLSGQDIANALGAQNLITPVGTQKIGRFEYPINLNTSPTQFETLAVTGEKPTASRVGKVISEPEPTIALIPPAASAAARTASASGTDIGDGVGGHQPPSYISAAAARRLPRAPRSRPRAAPAAPPARRSRRSRRRYRSPRGGRRGRSGGGRS